MNRIIKFRAWDGAKIVNITELRFFQEDRIPFGQYQNEGEEIYRGLGQYGVDYPLMQFTGLTDKNGKEIYEGDICKIPSQWFHNTPEDHVYEIEFYNGSFGKFNDGDWTVEPEDHEVIGNIYENPELLK